jgi:UPF0716 protein FxsA
MSILGRLALLFVIVPLVELALLIQMGQWVGFWPTIALVVFTGLSGAWLARMEGLRTLWKLRDDLAHGRVPAQAIMDGIAVFSGGALLLTPGILTDLIGFSLLIPGTRHAIQKRVMARLERSIQKGAVQVGATGGEIWTHYAQSTHSEPSSDPTSPDEASPHPLASDPMSSNPTAPARSPAE